MRKSNLLVGCTFIALSTALASPAFAQDTTPAAAPTCVDADTNGVCDADEDVGVTVVTGSRIARPNLDASNPVTSVTADDLTNTGDVNIGDNLNDLPSLRSTYSQGNSTRFIGTSGLNLLDLRGLGIERTLVLVNGRRHVTALAGEYLVDINTIPQDLLDRVDIVTGGTSAVYGSDAIAGVVNFVTKRDFDGITGRAQSGISSRGDRSTQYVSLTGGTNFSEGRGNIALSLSYTNSEPLYFSQRDDLTGAFSGRSQFNQADVTAGESALGDGIPDNLFYSRVRNGTISDGGMISAVCNAADVANTARCLPNPSGTARLPQRYMFLPNGNLVLNNAELDFRTITNGGSSNTIGGLGSTLRNTGQLFPQLERYSANLLAHFDVSEAFKPFIEAKYVRVNSFQEGQPSFIQGIPGFLGGGSDISCSNPYLNAQALATLQSIGRCATATSTIALSRFNVDFGGRRQDVQRETYRVVAGVEGTFLDTWRYEISANYGRFDERVDFLNNLLLFDINGNEAGFLLASDAVRNAAGDIVCRVNQVTVTNPACVPINLLGEQNYTQQQLDFIQTTGFSQSRAEQIDIMGFVSGDSSRLFELPGGPVAFSIGAEYREERASQFYDALTASGGTFLNAIQPLVAPNLIVKEVFGELRLPLLADLPFVNELSVEGAARYSDYNTAVGGVWAYNVGGIYSPTDGLRFRGNYSRSVRAPTQGDLYSPLSQNFAFIADPCDVQNINAGPNRAANCAAAGIPAGFINQPARDRSTGFVSGGNSTLTEETGTSYTLGFVYEPTFAPGFAITADYYNISVRNLIATLGAQTIINQCYDSATGINNPFCATVNRAADGTFVEPAVVSGGINYARQDTQGVDVNIDYTRRFDNGQRLAINFVATYVIELTNYISPTDPNFGDRQLSELGDPQFSANFGINYDFGKFQLGYSGRYIGQQYISSYEATNSFQGRAPTNPDVLPAGQQQFPGVYYHNIRFQFDVNDDTNFYVGIDNFTDRAPPFGQLGTAGGDPYDTTGRYFYAGIRTNFR